MKIGSNRNVLANNRQINEEDYVGVDTAKAWKLTDLLAQPYSEKDSFFREIVTNHIEAMLDADKNEPITVIMPAAEIFDDFHDGDNNSLFVTDTGIGLSEESIKNLVFQITASNKDDSDLRAGGKGVGSLSPLSVTTGFFFTSAKDGVLTKTQIFQAERGVAKPTVLRAYWDSKEAYVVGDNRENAVLVSFEDAGIDDWNGENFSTTQIPLNPDTISDIRKACEKRIQFYTKDQIHVVNSDFGHNQGVRVNNVRTYGNIELVKNAPGIEYGVYAMVAGVAYSLEGWSSDALSPFNHDELTYRYNYRANNVQKPLINIHLQNKQVSIPTTRETLTMTPETKRVVRSYISEAEKLFKAEATKYWEENVKIPFKNFDIKKGLIGIESFTELYSSASTIYSIPVSWNIISNIDLESFTQINLGNKERYSNDKFLVKNFNSMAGAKSIIIDVVKRKNTKKKILVIENTTKETTSPSIIFSQLVRDQGETREDRIDKIPSDIKSIFDRYQEYNVVMSATEFDSLTPNFGGMWGLNTSNKEILDLIDVVIPSDKLIEVGLIEVDRIDINSVDNDRKKINREVNKIARSEKVKNPKSDTRKVYYDSYVFNTKNMTCNSSSLDIDEIKNKFSNNEINRVIIGDTGSSERYFTPHIRSYETDSIEHLTVNKAFPDEKILIILPYKKSINVLSSKLDKSNITYTIISNKRSIVSIIQQEAKNLTGWKIPDKHNDVNISDVFTIKTLIDNGLQNIANHMINDINKYDDDNSFKLSDVADYIPDYVFTDNKFGLNLELISRYVHDKTGIRFNFDYDVRDKIKENPDFVFNFLKQLENTDLSWLKQ